MALSNSMFSLMIAQSNLDPESPQMTTLQNQLQAIQEVDKRLEMLLKRVDTQREAVQTEIQAVDKVLDKNIEYSFKTFA